MKLIAGVIALTIAAGSISSAFAADGAAVRPATIGGGIKRPWNPPYTLALAAPDLAPLGIVGAVAGMMLRRSK